MLRQVLSCRDGMTDSSAVARVADDAIGGDRFLPNMSTDDFLKCLSKGAMECAAKAQSVLPRNTGNATRAALIEQGTYILPAARFALTAAEIAKLDAKVAVPAVEDDVEIEEQEEPLDGEAAGENDRDDLPVMRLPGNDAGLKQAAA